MMLMGDVGLLDETLAMLPAPVLATRPSMQVFRGICQSRPADSDADGRRASARAFADACARLVRVHWDTMSLSELFSVVATGYMIQLRMLGRFQDSAAFGDRVNARRAAYLPLNPAGRQDHVRVVPCAKRPRFLTASRRRRCHPLIPAGLGLRHGGGSRFRPVPGCREPGPHICDGGRHRKGRRVAGTSPWPRHFDVARRPRDRDRRRRGCRVPGPRGAR